MTIINKGKCFLLALVTVGSSSSASTIQSQSQIQSQSRSHDCYEYPSCTATEFYDPVTGFTNDTGFAAPGSSECCQICLPGTSPTVCFDDTDLDCKAKTGNGDYDYVLFDQIWLPAFCASLENGFDPTLTHLEGSLCQQQSPQDSFSKLSIHGMWPNYYNGYPQCCDLASGGGEGEGGGSTVPLQPQEVVQWSSWPALQQHWPDRTAALAGRSPCAVCLILNHEWLKHGGCYSPGQPEKYFSDALAVNTKLTDFTTAINALAGQTVTTQSIEQLYPKNINVICDPNTEDTSGGHSSGSNSSAMAGRFLELRTCWSTAQELIDCPAAFSNAFGVPCPEYTHFLID